MAGSTESWGNLGGHKLISQFLREDLTNNLMLKRYVTPERTQDYFLWNTGSRQRAETHYFQCCPEL